MIASQSRGDRPRSATVLVLLTVAVVLVASVGMTGVVAGSDSGSIDSVVASEGDEDAGTRITSVGMAHVADITGKTVYLWQSDESGAPVDSYRIEVGIESASERVLCLVADGPGSCTRVGPNAETATAGLQLNESTDTTVKVYLQNPSSGKTVATESLTVVSITRDGDPDGDGLTNAEEVAAGTNLTESDSDGDGLSDAAELRRYDTDPTTADTDDDGLVDGEELTNGTSPTVGDTDGDGLTDGAETRIGTDPAAADTDGDGLDDRYEQRHSTSPTTADTDGDGLADGAELDAGTDPAVADSDGDGLADGAELEAGTDPLVADSDGDGLGDATERLGSTDPLVADTDDDGLTDGREAAVGTNPTATDSDGDLLSDRTEMTLGTDPTDAPLSPHSLSAVTVASLLAALIATLAGRVARRGDGGDGGSGVVVRAITVAEATYARTAGRAGKVGGWLVARAAALFGALSSVAYRVQSRVVAGVGAVCTSRILRLRRWVAVRVADGDVDLDATVPTSTAGAETPEADSVPIASGADTVREVVTQADEGVDDERLVGRLLAVEDGRLKQGEIVDHTDWSKAKVSRLLTRMAEDGTVIKIRIGRENLICLPGAEPTITSSTLDRQGRAPDAGVGAD